MSHAEPSVLIVDDERVKIVEIANGRGTYFDPDVIEAFRARGDDFRRVALSYAEKLPS